MRLHGWPRIPGWCCANCTLVRNLRLGLWGPVNLNRQRRCMPAVCPHAGHREEELRLPALNKLTALHSASMSGKTIRLGGALPPSLTFLEIHGSGKEDTMLPVSLQHS